MKLPAATLLAAGLTWANAEVVEHCGTRDPPPETIVDIAELAGMQHEDWTAVNKTYEIKTYMHVILTEADKDKFQTFQLDKQIEIMNKAYAPAGFSFALQAITYTVNDFWADHLVQNVLTELEFKNATRTGGYADLNLWILSNLENAVFSGTTMGIAKLPVSSPSNKQRILDGAMIWHGTLPGGQEMPFVNGSTAVHETGHWLGLYHTFSGESCEGPGDGVSDTPQQSVSSDGLIPPCELRPRRNSCPDQPGFDPSDNYMDYGYCRHRFTPMQVQRMKYKYGSMRAGK